MDNKKWEFVDRNEVAVAEDTRGSLTYWSDVWRRFRSNKLAILGLIMLVIIIMLAVFGPLFSTTTYSDQNLELANLPPRLKITKIDNTHFVFVQESLYNLINVTEKGEVLGTATLVKNDMMKRQKIFDIDGLEVVMDYSKAQKGAKLDADGMKYDLLVNGEKINAKPIKTVWNKTYFMGTDKMGRDVWIRTLYGGRISLMVGIVSALLNMIVGVVYGGIAGYEGGKVDNVMMRIVDLINSIPLMLIVILIMVFTGQNSVSMVIITIGLVYWLSMARQVRGQVMSLKEQEFVLAARTLGASKMRIIFKHLVPNAMGPIVVSMMMSIPSSIFTEAFLGFVGLGVAAPNASWGTLANDALGGIRSYPYLLIIPSVAIALTMFAFNFVGDGLRDALDPKQRQ